MKKILSISLLLLTMATYSQEYKPGVLLGLTYKEVFFIMHHQKNTYRMSSADSTLTFFNTKNKSIVTYTFRYRRLVQYCVSCSLKITPEAAEELIKYHEKDWQIINDSQWLYKTEAYDIPLTVTKRINENLIEFIYKYVPNV